VYPHRLTRIAALTLVAGALAVPVASAAAPPEQDFRNPDNRQVEPVGPSQDLRSPDAVDAAAGRGTFNAPDVMVVKVKDAQPGPAADGGIDWGDAGIGAGGLAGLTLVSLGGALLVVHRRHPRPSAHA
jgi:hypothetical protein